MPMAISITASRRPAVVVKFRVSNTTLKVGDLQPTSPVFATADNYLMPQTASSFQINSNEIMGLNLEAGHYTAGTGNTTTSRSGDILASYAGVEAASASFGGRQVPVQ